MIAKKYQFYIDNKVQDDFHQVKHIVIKPDRELLDKYHKNNPNIDRLMILFTEHILNSDNIFVKRFVEENNIKEELLIRLVRKYEKVKIVTSDCVDIDRIPPGSEFFTAADGMIKKTFKEVKESSYPSFIKILTETLSFYNLYVNVNNDIIISDFLVKTKELDIKYKIYVNDRLLIERFFPYNLPLQKILSEECYLNLKENATVKIVSDHNLIFKKVTTDNGSFNPNSAEFILEP